MNDRFKFRAWNKDTKTMHEVESVYPYKDEYTQGGEVFLKGFKTSYYFPEQVELMQCTGLKDKKGKLIYQGDILGDIYEGLYIHYCTHCHQFQLYSQSYGCMACNGDIHWIEVMEDNKKLEVIGNIYENKELLNDMENN